MEDSRKILCERCRKFVPISEIKYTKKGDDSQMAICSVCRARVDKKESDSLKETVQKKPYYCNRCKYKFKFNPQSKNVLSCPYCGRSDKIIEDKKRSAENIIKESEYLY